MKFSNHTQNLNINNRWVKDSRKISHFIAQVFSFGHARLTRSLRRIKLNRLQGQQPMYINQIKHPITILYDYGSTKARKMIMWLCLNRFKNVNLTPSSRMTMYLLEDDLNEYYILELLLAKCITSVSSNMKLRHDTYLYGIA